MEVNRRAEWPAMVGHTQCLGWNDHVKTLVKPHPRLVVRKILVCPSVLALTWILGVHHLVNSCFCKTRLALTWHHWWAYCFKCFSLCLGLMWWQSLFPFHVKLSYLSAMQQKQWTQFQETQSRKHAFSSQLYTTVWVSGLQRLAFLLFYSPPPSPSLETTGKKQIAAGYVQWVKKKLCP